MPLDTYVIGAVAAALSDCRADLRHRFPHGRVDDPVRNPWFPRR